MIRRVATLALLSALLLTSLFPAGVAAETAVPFPDTMAAVGDSITQAASTGGTLGADAPQNSWSTGTNSTVNSHYLRLLGLGAPISGQNHNKSVSGAKAAGLNAQMQTVIPLQPDYLTVLIGGNDLCTDTVGQMTTVETFRAQLETAMATLSAGSPGTHIYVVSIPNVYQLWNLFKNDFWARFIWDIANICQSLLANPTSTNSLDVARRETVRLRNIDYNTQLAQVCALYVQCRFDGNAVFNTTFTTGDVSGDYFHPSIAGQAKLASVSWNAGYMWAAPPPPNQAPTADFSVSCPDLTCSFTDASIDDAGIQQWAWAFGDGGSSSQQNPTHPYAQAGTYEVTLTVTDGGALSDSETKQVLASQPSAEPMFIQSISGTPTSTGRNTWSATVTIVIYDSVGRFVENATMSATWSTGLSASCTTNANGTCSVSSGNLNKRKIASVTLSVNDITHATLTYDDGGVPATTTVQRP